MSTSRQNRTTGSRSPRNLGPRRRTRRPRTGRTRTGMTDRGRLHEMAAGGMDSLLMTQPVRWPGVVAGFRQANPGAFGKLARWPAGQESEDGDQGAPVFPLLQSVRPCGSWIPEHGILSMRSSWPVRRDNGRRARRSR